MKHKIAFLFVLVCPIVIFIQKTNAQEKLTLQQAVAIALENNYNIKLTSNAVEIAKINKNPANAGMIPVVTGNLTTNNTLSNTTQTLSNGESQQRNGARNTNLSYGPELNWQIFDGFEMFIRYDQLKELQNLGEAGYRLTVQTTIADIISSYYDLVQQKQQIKALDTALVISRLRLQNSQSRYQIGRAAKLEVLAASVDLNTDTTNLLRQRDLFRGIKISLNEIMARDIDIDFTVEDTIIIQNNLQLKDLQAVAGTQNPSLQSAVINQRISELNLKQVKANRYPDIGLNTGYNFNRSTSELGFARTSRGRGFNYGLTASVNIFNGFLQRRNEKAAAVEVDNAKIQHDQLNLNINSQLASLYQTYVTNVELVKLEEKNVNVAKENLDITLVKFKLGSIAPLELREAQRNFLDASVRFTNAQYQAKLAEVSLKEIAGSLSL